MASFPIRAGWARAVLAGHAAVERRLEILAPALVLLSRRAVREEAYRDLAAWLPGYPAEAPPGP